MYELLAAALFFLLLVFAALYFRAVSRLRSAMYMKQSLSVKYGKMTEQFFPFMKDYAHDPANFRFIGTPIDGIQFDEDRIIFVEFKSASSRMTGRQKRVRDLVRQGKVGFEEMRLE